MTFKSMLLGAMLSALLVGGSSTYALAENVTSNHTDLQPTQPKMDHRHGEKHRHHKLSDEEKAALKQAGVDITALQETEKELKLTFLSIRENSKALKQAAQGNDVLKAKLHSDLRPIKDNFKQVRELRKTNHELRQNLKAALDAKDNAKIKQVYNDLVANQQQALKLLQAIDAAMKAEVAKIKA